MEKSERSYFTTPFISVDFGGFRLLYIVTSFRTSAHDFSLYCFSEHRFNPHGIPWPSTEYNLYHRTMGWHLPYNLCLQATNVLNLCCAHRLAVPFHPEGRVLPRSRSHFLWPLQRPLRLVESHVVGSDRIRWAAAS